MPQVWRLTVHYVHTGLGKVLRKMRQILSQRWLFEHPYSQWSLRKAQTLPKCTKYLSLEKLHSHLCNKFKCPSCKEIQPFGHRCFLQPPAKDLAPVNHFIHIYYDLETYKDTDNQLHPYRAVAEKICEKCIKVIDIASCRKCGQRLTIFYGVDCMRIFCTWLFQNKHADAIVMAHDGGKYAKFAPFSPSFTVDIF